MEWTQQLEFKTDESTEKTWSQSSVEAAGASNVTYVLTLKIWVCDHQLGLESVCVFTKHLSACHSMDGKYWLPCGAGPRCHGYIITAIMWLKLDGQRQYCKKKKIQNVSNGKTEKDREKNYSSMSLPLTSVTCSSTSFIYWVQLISYRFRTLQEHESLALMKWLGTCCFLRPQVIAVFNSSAFSVWRNCLQVLLFQDLSVHLNMFYYLYIFMYYYFLSCITVDQRFQWECKQKQAWKHMYWLSFK